MHTDLRNATPERGVKRKSPEYTRPLIDIQCQRRPPLPCVFFRAAQPPASVSYYHSSFLKGCVSPGNMSVIVAKKEEEKEGNRSRFPAKSKILNPKRKANTLKRSSKDIQWNKLFKAPLWPPKKGERCRKEIKSHNHLICTKILCQNYCYWRRWYYFSLS